MKNSNIRPSIDAFMLKSNPTDRYSSFDYCYNYFHKVRGKKLMIDIEKSCLTISFYLASWGMFRGSSFLLEKSAKHFEPTLHYIATLDKSVWLIDVDSYTQNNIDVILRIYSDLKNLLITNNNSSLTLVTKIMLGVFGFVPAFDQCFCDTFRELFKYDKCKFRALNSNSLNCIKSFYDSNKLVIDKLSSTTFTTDFASGNKTTINYSKAKIIDMYGFITGLEINKQ